MCSRFAASEGKIHGKKITLNHVGVHSSPLNFTSMCIRACNWLQASHSTLSDAGCLPRQSCQPTNLAYLLLHIADQPGKCLSCLRAAFPLPVQLCLLAFKSHVSGCLQKHNEQKLCEAFDHSKDVFLIFSVNMSGHFQGYARMVSTSNSRQVLPAYVTQAMWLHPLTAVAMFCVTTSFGKAASATSVRI